MTVRPTSRGAEGSAPIPSFVFERPEVDRGGWRPDEEPHDGDSGAERDGWRHVGYGREEDW